MFGLTSTFDTLWNFQRAMENAMSADYFGPSTCASGTPKLNLFQEDENSVVTVELPGLKKEDLSIEVQGEKLRISGERHSQVDEKASLHRRERRDYRFDRTITLPHEVDDTKVEAELKNGILAILLPMKEEHKPKEITIS